MDLKTRNYFFLQGKKFSTDHWFCLAGHPFRSILIKNQPKKVRYQYRSNFFVSGPLMLRFRREFHSAFLFWFWGFVVCYQHAIDSTEQHLREEIASTEKMFPDILSYTEEFWTTMSWQHERWISGLNAIDSMLVAYSKFQKPKEWSGMKIRAKSEQQRTRNSKVTAIKVFYHNLTFFGWFLSKKGHQLSKISELWFVENKAKFEWEVQRQRLHFGGSL